MNKTGLIDKYNIPAPRYTSYPTVPFWDEYPPSLTRWLKVVAGTFNESNAEKGISLYIHLPFCESLCTYCACSTRITKNHQVEKTYIQAVLAEWELYQDHFSTKPVIRELHLGGGTPTFFSPTNLKKLITSLLRNTELHPNYEFGFEGHPNNTTEDHLKALHSLGFKRASFGIQDFDEKVQRTINRLQSYEKVVQVTKLARQIGYESINFDLIYGLPYQTTASIENTVEKVARLMPDRIAFYSYAHVPWIKPGQRSYTTADLPDSVEKRDLYELGKKLLIDLGYEDIGMDHFALKTDPLYLAKQNKTLHRNFMGYTTSHTDLLIGLGVSAISDAKYAYAQNLKKVEAYQAEVLHSKLAIIKGHEMTKEDLDIKFLILDIICKGKANSNFSVLDSLDLRAKHELKTMTEEGLIVLNKGDLEVTELGQAFIRNICMVFDAKLRNHHKNVDPIFSKAI